MRGTYIEPDWWSVAPEVRGWRKQPTQRAAYDEPPRVTAPLGWGQPELRQHVRTDLPRGRRIPVRAEPAHGVTAAPARGEPVAPSPALHDDAERSDVGETAFATGQLDPQDSSRAAARQRVSPTDRASTLPAEAGRGPDQPSVAGNGELRAEAPRASEPGSDHAAAHEPLGSRPGASEPRGAGLLRERSARAELPIDGEDRDDSAEVTRPGPHGVGRVEDLQERLRAALSELEASKRRIEREADKQRDSVKASVVVELLPVLDDLRRSIDAARGKTDDALVQGLDLVCDSFERVLLHLGAERIDAEGEPFDPRVHEALGVLPVRNAEQDGVVVKQWLAGYRLGERVVRPAQVMVGRLGGS